MQIQLEEIIDESVEKVFSTMLSLPIRHNPQFSGWSNPDHLVAGSVGFTGVFSGILYFCMELPFACTIASQMLGLPSSEIEKDGLLVDAIGELTNMIAGQLKSILCDRGYGLQPDGAFGYSGLVHGAQPSRHQPVNAVFFLRSQSVPDRAAHPTKRGLKRANALKSAPPTDRS